MPLWKIGKDARIKLWKRILLATIIISIGFFKNSDLLHLLIPRKKWTMPVKILEFFKIRIIVKLRVWTRGNSFKIVSEIQKWLRLLRKVLAFLRKSLKRPSTDVLGINFILKYFYQIVKFQPNDWFLYEKEMKYKQGTTFVLSRKPIKKETLNIFLIKSFEFKKNFIMFLLWKLISISCFLSWKIWNINFGGN